MREKENEMDNEPATFAIYTQIGQCYVQITIESQSLELETFEFEH